jgi:hypothetical protein
MCDACTICFAATQAFFMASKTRSDPHAIECPRTRAVLPDAKALTRGDRQLLEELLDRLAAGRPA